MILPTALMDEYNLTKPAETRWQVLIQSFSPQSLEKIHALNPSLPLIQLFFGSETSQTIQARLDLTATYAVGIGPRFSSVDRALIDAAHARCLDVHPYTVNDQPLMERLIELGVDGMFTNFPDRLDEVLGKEAVGGKAAAIRAADAQSACLVGQSSVSRAPEPGSTSAHSHQYRVGREGLRRHC